MNMAKKKICFISQFPPPMHGLSKAVETLYNSYLKDEFSFEKIDIKDNKTIFNTLLKLFTNSADMYYFTISQSKGGNLRDLLFLAIIRLRKKKCLIHLHGGFYRTLIEEKVSTWQRRLNYNAMAKVDGAIVLGPSLKWIFNDMVQDEIIFTVPNCVDDQYLMSDEDFNDKINSFSKRKVKHVLYLSNFIRSKGYAEVLEMAKKEKEKEELEADNDVVFHFDFAGKFFDEEERKYFDTFVKNNALEDYVTYHGIITGKEKLELLKLCDIFVLLTRYPKEGQPISILEAMGNGMMIVTTDHAGIPDIVTDGVNGIVVHEGIPDLRSSITDIQKYERINRETIKELYTEQRYIASMRQVFDSVLRKENGKKTV